MNEGDIDENGQLLKDDSTEDSNETLSEPRETQLTSFDANSVETFSRKKAPSTCGSVISVETVNNSESAYKKKPSSNCGSVVSIEAVSLQICLFFFTPNSFTFSLLTAKNFER